jgi:hypothetical protein
MPPLLLLLAGVLGCNSGPSAETLVSELRVLAVLADLPEARPGETVLLESLVVDPLDNGYDAIAWSCTFTGESCLESAGFTGVAWDGLVGAESPEDPWLPSAYAVPQQLAEFVSDEPVPLVQHWTLACEPGLCPVIDDALAAPEPGSAAASSLQDQLSDPFAVLETLPMQGVSLALRSISVSTRSDEERVSNPTVACRPKEGELGDPLSVEAGGRLPLWCDVSGTYDGDGAMWGYTTAGGWEGEAQELDNGDTDKEYVFIGPEEVPDALVPIWVVISDGFGGVGIWEGEVEVTAPGG